MTLFEHRVGVFQGLAE